MLDNIQIVIPYPVAMIRLNWPWLLKIQDQMTSFYPNFTSFYNLGTLGNTAYNTLV